MTKLERLQQTTLSLMKTLRVISTTQVTTFLSDHGSPEKRASELLLSLKEKGLIEGKRRFLDKPKVWRLTLKGRLSTGANYHPVPFNSPKIDHFLGLGNIYLYLSQIGINRLRDFRLELREPFVSIKGKPLKFCPDAYFIYNNRAYVLELQLTPITSKKWAEKWKIYEEYFLFEHYLKASWQKKDHAPIKPNIIVISNQQRSTITESCKLPIRVIKSIEELRD